MYLVRCVELIEMLKTNSKNIDLHSRTHIFIKKKGPKNKKKCRCGWEKWCVRLPETSNFFTWPNNMQEGRLCKNLH